MTAETGRTDLVASEAEELRELVARTRYVLFDFDGPICRLFAGHPAGDIAREQVEWLDARGMGWVLTEEERLSPDPHGVLSSLARRRPLDCDLIVGLEAHLTQQELRAALSAWPTAHADPLIRTWVAVGVPLAVVSNNSALTVAAYLSKRGTLSCFEPHIYGRTQNLSLLKPNPKPLNLALTAMGASPETALMIGDTPSDHTAARLAGVRFLGYARNPESEKRMRDAGVPAEGIMRSLEPLLLAVRHSEPRLR